jgi:hypothetical protein
MKILTMQLSPFSHRLSLTPKYPQNGLRLLSSLNVADQVSHPHKTGTVSALHVTGNTTSDTNTNTDTNTKLPFQQPHSV